MGDDPAEERRASRQLPTLAQFITDRYLPFIKGYKRSWDTDESLLRNHILPVFGSHAMNKITRYDLTKFMHAKKEAGLAPGTANRLTIIMRYIFNLALQWDIPGITENPARGVKLFQLNNKTERYLTDEEVPKLLAAMRASQNKQLEPIVTMLLLTGARKREVLDARWKDFTLNTRLWRVPTTKAGHARHVPLSEAAIELLDALPSKDTSDYLFPNPKTGKPFVSIFYAWDTARRHAGMPEVRIHDLRHSFASFLINAGYSLYVVQKLLGHHSISVTER
jgi:integrase